MKQTGEINLHLVLTIFLGLGMVLFGVLAIVAYQDNHHTQTHLSELNAAAATNAAVAQKKNDAIANAKANEQPYQTYTADPIDGSFQMQFPKNWSIYAAKNPGASTPLDLIADPGVVNNFLDGSINTHQFELTLSTESLIDENKTFESALKKGTLTSKAYTVSGIPATWFQGTLDSKGHQGVIVTLQDRNETMVITDDTMDYLSDFTAILNSAVIHP
jgi:hypothetical protein